MPLIMNLKQRAMLETLKVRSFGSVSRIFFSLIVMSVITSSRLSLDYNIPLVLVNTALDIEEGSGKYAILESNQLNTTNKLHL
jgi:hypothetical protein